MQKYVCYIDVTRGQRREREREIEREREQGGWLPWQ